MKKRCIAKTLALLRPKEDVTMLEKLKRKHTAFQLLIATILSARAKDEMTTAVAERLFERYPDALSLARARHQSVERIIKCIGFYRRKASYVIAAAKHALKHHDGSVPCHLNSLMAFPGVGRKVANCMLVYAFRKDAIPVDTHVHRIANRLGWVRARDPERTEKLLEKIVPKRYWQEVNERLVLHGKNVCQPLSPKCSACILHERCPKKGVTRSR